MDALTMMRLALKTQLWWFGDRKCRMSRHVSRYLRKSHIFFQFWGKQRHTWILPLPISARQSYLSVCRKDPRERANRGVSDASLRFKKKKEKTVYQENGGRRERRKSEKKPKRGREARGNRLSLNTRPITSSFLRRAGPLKPAPNLRNQTVMKR